MRCRGLAKRVIEFRDQCRRIHQRHPAQRLQGLHHRRQRPVRQHPPDGPSQAIPPLGGGLDGGDEILEHDVVHRLIKLQSGEPSAVHQRPGWALIVPPVAQQKARELLARLAELADCGEARPHQIAHRFVRRIRNPDRGQFAGARQPRQMARVPPVGLDALARFARDQ